MTKHHVPRPDPLLGRWYRIEIFAELAVFPGCLFFMAQVHSTQFMESAEVENHDNCHTNGDGYIHTQDRRGFYIIYDVNLEDPKEIGNSCCLWPASILRKKNIRYPQVQKTRVRLALFKVGQTHDLNCCCTSARPSAVYTSGTFLYPFS